jgi:hypothetical protein
MHLLSKHPSFHSSFYAFILPSCHSSFNTSISLSFISLIYPLISFTSIYPSNQPSSHSLISSIHLSFQFYIFPHIHQSFYPAIHSSPSIHPSIPYIPIPYFHTFSFLLCLFLPSFHSTVYPIHLCNLWSILLCDNPFNFPSNWSSFFLSFFSSIPYTSTCSSTY